MEALTDLLYQPQRTADTNDFDPFYTECKNACDFPLWLKLQHDIRAGLEQLLAETAHALPEDFAERLNAINNRISDYNKHVPSVFLRKPVLTPGNWTDKCEDWL